MDKKIHSGMMLTMLLMGMLMLAFTLQPVKAEPTTWTVDDDGPADFSRIQDAINTANSRDRIYVHNGTYYENLFVTKNNLTIVGESRISTIIDGGTSGSVIQVEADHVILSGFTVQRGYEGVSVHHTNGTTIANNIITNNKYRGVFLADSYDSVIIENHIMNTYEGIHVRGEGSNNMLKYNLVADEYYGITFLECHEELHIVSSNTLVDNTYNIYLPDSSGIKFYHNNFFKKYRQVYGGYLNTWDDGYPSGGNYWSDYEERYPDAEELDDSGLWDTPYVIDDYNQDNYPLMEPWTPKPPIPTTIDGLKIEIEELGSEGEIDNQGIVTSLFAKLDAAQKLIDDGKIDQAKNILNAFINEVQAQSEKHITLEAAELLIESAEYIISNL